MKLVLKPFSRSLQWRELKRKAGDHTPSSSPGSVEKMVGYICRNPTQHDPIRFTRLVKKIVWFGHDFV